MDGFGGVLNGVGMGDGGVGANAHRTRVVDWDRR